MIFSITLLPLGQESICGFSYFILIKNNLYLNTFILYFKAQKQIIVS